MKKPLPAVRATITQRGNSWRVQIRKKDEKPQYGSFKTKLAAEKWARSIEREMDEGIFVSRKEARMMLLTKTVIAQIFVYGTKQQADRQTPDS